MKNIILAILILAVNGQVFGQNKMELSSKQIVKIITITQPLDTVWAQWTTHEGLKTFFGADNKIELMPGGAFEIYFQADGPKGQRGSEGCKILSYLPNKYLSFSWNAPPKFKEVRKSGYKTWVVVEFLPIAPKKTRITLTHTGWPTDTLWHPVFEYFTSAWDMVLNELAKTGKDGKTLEPFTIKVTGIGGIFFKCKDPEKVKEWYKKHLGFDTDRYGTNFEWRQSSNPDKPGFTQWSPFNEKTKYFDPSTKEFMINYRVDNLEALVRQLKTDGVTVLDSIEVYEYGKFVHILDLEGNKIELWEPIDVEYDKIVEGRTK